MFEGKHLKFLKGSIVRIFTIRIVTIKLKFCLELLSKPKKKQKSSKHKKKAKKLQINFTFKNKR
jgi:hypothetical protein